MSKRRKRNYWPRLTECLIVAGLIYVFAVGVTNLLYGHSFHSWKAATPRQAQPWGTQVR